MSESAPKTTYSNDPALYLYTSLTSGSSHIVTATSRMETILKANRIPFKAIDIATDEKARMLWGRRAGKDESGRQRKIPGLVQMGLVVGDLVEIEDWNEYGELKQHVTIVPVPGAPVAKVLPKTTAAPAKAPVSQENKKPESSSAPETSKAAEPAKSPTTDASPALALRQIGQEAAQKAKDGKKKAVETFSGVGQAEAPKESKESKEPEEPKEAEKAIPAPIAVPEKATETHTVESTASLQSPTSTAWKASGDKKHTPRNSIDKVESIQSPNSTAWRPTDVNPPILTHRGSTVSDASAEEIKKIEEEESIPEEDEDEEEESSDED
ncbi:hypothetical protein DL95DRAFT_383423 [Leptodontidium sp. 2 PMI_412]|nr:hypothetical protein BKA61DRAFT_9275 [Leptodontidium sp. MPI-SDFR-AT-0119]KAH9220082.1 hypothetical protein DL95DRAFT_383423 [Leptodontidium sp. 2 PMI_412]